MFRLKTLIGIAGVFAVLAISAAPASAWWEATGKQWKGPVRIISAGSFNDAGTPVECVANEIKATWSIQTKGQIKIHEKEGKQLQTKTGPHLHINILSWGKCKAAGTVEAKVSPCELQLVQEKGILKATGGVVTPCIIKVEALGCTILVPAGMEKSPQSNEGLNVGLKEVELENNVNNQKDKVNISGQILAILAAGGGGCPATNSTASLTGLEFEVEGAKAI
jgi:hypothetical protein